MQQIIIEEERYHQVKGTIDARNALLEKAWLKLEASGVKHGFKIPMSEISKVLGPVFFKQLKQRSHALMEQITMNVTSSAEAMKSLRFELIRMYPKIKFINVILPPLMPAASPPAVAKQALVRRPNCSRPGEQTDFNNGKVHSTRKR